MGPRHPRTGEEPFEPDLPGAVPAQGVTAGEDFYTASTAQDWWGARGRFRVLRHLNPLRLAYIGHCTGGLSGRRVLDVGCGGGVLAEAMALQGARVIGLDTAAGALHVASAHAPAGLSLEYVHGTLERYLDSGDGDHGFDAVVCMELLEHVHDPASLVRQCAGALRAGGALICSTLNRGLYAYLMAVVGAEYLAGLVPMGTHDYRYFLRPAELAGMARAAGLRVMDVRGMLYVPTLQRAFLSALPRVHYLLHAAAPEGSALRQEDAPAAVAGTRQSGTRQSR